MTPAGPEKKPRAEAWNAEAHRRQVLERAGMPLAENVTRRWGPWGKFKHDLLGFGDLIVFDRKTGLWLEQITVRAHLAAHITSALANEKLRPKWLDLGFRARLVCYADPKGRKAGDFTPRLLEVAAMPSSPGLRLLEPA